MLSGKKTIFNKSFDNNLESYIRNLKINNPDKEINLDFLKNYFKKVRLIIEFKTNIRIRNFKFIIFLLIYFYI